MFREIFLTKAAESFILKKKNHRWDYLLVQGKFMKDKAYDCFNYNKEILDCGYPRTDVLFNTNKK